MNIFAALYSRHHMLIVNDSQVWNTSVLKEHCKRLYATFRALSRKQGSKKTCFMDKPRTCGLWKWTRPDFFSEKPPKTPFYKISYQDFTFKQTLIWWVCYHLRTVIRNPRRNIGWIKCKQSTSFYALRCSN